MEHPNAHGIHKQNKLPECRVKESRTERERERVAKKERMIVRECCPVGVVVCSVGLGASCNYVGVA